MQKEENEIDLGLFLELAEENNIISNQLPVNTLLQDIEKLKNGFVTKSYFSLGDNGEIETNRFFRDSSEFMDKRIDKNDDLPSIYSTGNSYKFFRNFKWVKRSEHGRGAEFWNLRVETVIYLVAMQVF